MLAIFHKAFAHPPEELRSPASDKKAAQLPQDTLRTFLTSHPNNAFSMSFADAAVLAYVTPLNHSLLHQNQRLFCGYDDVYCLFMGSLNNLCAQIKQYGLSRNSNEAMVVIEAYKTLRDRGPYPADQVIKDLDGTFAFVLYDSKVGTVFTALGSNGGVKLYWGIAADGSVVISDDLDVIKAGCAKSFAPFPTGCIFHSEAGLMSFEHPMHKLRAMPRVDSEGAICGANFKVDLYSRVNSIPRVGSETNWVDWASHQS
ncbi:stem-specific protein TSJT1-like [Salvia hispanica]|uniref:stem-specific protein TSJT1-like n=1 Tax=Salvia hispanica TaxID=49212 RepID=UPI0020093BE9|nr:stem-specific protein TSJT1-like [Salvia hispanica]